MISTATALAYLGAPSSASALVAGIVDRATATLQRALGFYIGSVDTRTAVRDGSEYGRFTLDEIILLDDVLDPTDAEPITIEYLANGWEWTAIATELWRRDGRRFYHRYGWPSGKRSIRFTYRAGWDVDTGPGELRDLVLRLTQLRYVAAGDVDTPGGLIQSETLSDYSYSLKDDAKLEADWNATVKAWSRRIPV